MKKTNSDRFSAFVVYFFIFCCLTITGSSMVTFYGCNETSEDIHGCDKGADTDCDGLSNKIDECDLEFALTESGCPECRVDEDCQTDEVCDTGICTVPHEGATVECHMTSDCPSGQICQTGSCVNGGTNPCTSDSDCDSGFYCVSGDCVEQQTDVCQEDVDCPMGHTCDSGSCVEDNCLCRMNSDCGSGYECSSCECVRSDVCYSSNDCGSGEACYENKCIPGCESDSDCGPGYFCDSDNLCYEDTYECYSSDDCGSNEYCSNGVCVSTCQQNDCCDDSDCGANEVCSNGNCVSSSSCQEECCDDSDCASDEQCVNSRCESVNSDECTADRECNEGYVCLNGQCCLDDGGNTGDLPAAARSIRDNELQVNAYYLPDPNTDSATFLFFDRLSECPYPESIDNMPSLFKDLPIDSLEATSCSEGDGWLCVDMTSISAGCYRGTFFETDWAMYGPDAYRIEDPRYIWIGTDDRGWPDTGSLVFEKRADGSLYPGGNL